MDITLSGGSADTPAGEGLHGACVQAFRRVHQPGLSENHLTWRAGDRAVALVVLLKGINVGGNRSFRPSVLAEELKKFDVVSVGAAGTLIARSQVSRRDLQAEIKRRLPFEAAVMICSGTDILRLVAEDPFARHVAAPGIVQFLSLMAKHRPPPPSLPFDLPAEGRWCVRVLRVQDRFVLGLHRREMRAIRYLAQVGEVLGVEATTRSWSTILAVARVLRQ